jgi:hypothetical protein
LRTVPIPGVTMVLPVPNFPTHNLGPLAGSGCDTVTTEIEGINKEVIQLNLYPNPVTDVLTVSFDFSGWKADALYLEIVDALGQLVYHQRLPQYSGLQKIDVSQFTAGLYTACIKRNNGVVATAKFAKH